MCTRPFSIPRTVTNLDIGKNSDIKLEPGFKFSSEASDKIKNIALSTGKLPAGTYTFTVDLIGNADCNATSLLPHTEVIVINIRNFSRVDLISPLNESAVPNTFPLFQWIYDGDSVEVTVAELKADQHSREEALSGVPMLDIRTGDASGLLPLGSHSLQYPSAGAGVRPLEQGKTYVWQVKGLSRGTGGAGATINSEIWQFSVGTSTTNESTSHEQEHTMSLLQLLAGLNADVLNQLLGGNLQLTGYVMLNGRPVSAAEILRILNDLSANPDKVIDIQLVSL